MNDTQAKYPQLRFKGFADPWEQRKVSELADRYDNLRVPITASERVAGETPYYGANGIQDYVEGFTHNGEFVLVAEDGANDLQNYPVQYVDGKVWVNNHAHVLQAKEERADNKFLTNALKHTNIEPYLVGGGRAKLNADVMMKINFKVPTLPEQVQIGKFFDNLDHLITLHQRKLDLLKEQKKGYLQKMFPKNGAKVPELRFAGFADDWEERKLGDITTWTKGQGLSKEYLNNERHGSEAVHYADLYKFSPVVQEVIHWTNSDDGRIIPDNSLLFPASDVTPVGLARTSTLRLSGVKAGGDVIIGQLSERINSSFMSYQINANSKKILPLITGTTVKHVQAKSLATMSVTITNMAEQTAIAGLFERIDNLIALHQRKLDLLKEQKKGFLQKMFV
ncbi:restriction endonuclease subunit S [Lactobacillus delbrueckii]|uniref:restriction endonuclease subunit S n=1 Tax=Lactobacillus delbrueckii TaxID=1584 RepID=UPI001E633825|nr:restriction endonuclease subunit S [Lactobacillus delbrueckii]MCD5545467.1 restriction endonuclease subunit S [Lactobacillus delbrueckii subsp. lactis]